MAISTYNCNKGVMDRYRICFEDMDTNEVMSILVKSGISGNIYQNEIGFDTASRRTEELKKLKRCL